MPSTISSLQGVERRLTMMLSEIRKNHKRSHLGRAKSGPEWHRNMADRIAAARAEVQALRKGVDNVESE